MRWRVKCTTSGIIIASGFRTLGEANDWHDSWADCFEDGVTPSVTFEKYDPIANLVITSAEMAAQVTREEALKGLGAILGVSTQETLCAR